MTKLYTIVCLAALLSTSQGQHHTKSTSSLEGWISKQYKFALDHVFSAINPKPDTFPGTIMASPTIVKPNPDYFYHWVRDASLTMDAIAGLLERSQNEKERKDFYNLFERYNNLTDRLQNLEIPKELKQKKNFDTSQWLGEPKFLMTAKPFTGDWGRPQNDGPASRAFAMTRFTKYMLHRYQDTYHLYNATIPRPLNKDLEYVSKNWKKPSFEIWEEVKGMHFYTLMVQRRSMIDGAMLAKRLKDEKSAAQYSKTAQEISSEINKFWNPRKGYVTVTHGRVDGVDYKESGLDSQVVLASLHASTRDGFYTPESDRILSSWMALVDRFSKLYPDNYKHPDRAPAIGRYPEDQYNGYTAFANGGNGWMLITAGMAECVYRVHNRWLIEGEFKVTRHNLKFLKYITHSHFNERVGHVVRQGDREFSKVLDALVKTGDWFLKTVRLHTEKNGLHLNEQWNRLNGTQQGAADLTWSYTSFLTAIAAREQAKNIK